jgi:hypothetical protein
VPAASKGGASRHRLSVAGDTLTTINHTSKGTSMSDNARLHLNGVDYDLADPFPGGPHGPAFQALERRVLDMLTEAGPAIQRFDITRDGARATLIVAVEQIATACVCLTGAEHDSHGSNIH